MPLKLKFFVLLIFAIFLFSKCSYKKSDIAYPATPCDTTGVRLSVELKEILTANCFSCHGGEADDAAGIKLENYDVISRFALDGTLLSAITHNGNAVPMPKGGGKLSDCEISKFSAWINAGAPNN